MPPPLPSSPLFILTSNIRPSSFSNFAPKTLDLTRNRTRFQAQSYNCSSSFFLPAQNSNFPSKVFLRKPLHNKSRSNCSQNLSLSKTHKSSQQLLKMSTSGYDSTPLVDELLKVPSTQVKDKAKVEKILQGLVKGGKDSLQFVVDFDYTLTRVHLNGERVECSWGVFEHSSLLPSDYTEQTKKLKEKYLKIECDPKMSIEEKTPFMIEWYTKANKLLQTSGVEKSMFPKMVKSSNVAFRDRTDEMLNKLTESNVPLLVLSAGLGDLVVEILKHFDLMHASNTKVVSNFLAFDPDGKVCGIEGEMIHVFNKNESAVHDSPYFKELQSRHNIVLLGDSLGDLRMADGVENPENLLKIGFLNVNLEERKQNYMEQYDIVLMDDQTMDCPLAILDQILEK